MSTLEMIINVTAPLLGTIVGGTITYFTQSKMNKAQRAKEEINERRELKREKMSYYGEILRLDGEFSPCDETGIQWLSKEEYINEIRPIIYNKIYLLTSEMINQLRKLDKKVDLTLNYSHAEIEDESEAAALYIKFIKLVEHEIKNWH